MLHSIFKYLIVFLISAFVLSGCGDTKDSSEKSIPSGLSPLSVNFTSNTTSVSYNGSVSLSWSSGNADSCTASGDWTGSKGTSGSQTINSLTADSNFALSCTGLSGTLSKTVNVSVASAPVPITVNLTSNSTSVPYNGSVSLSWSSGNANSCTASGDWTGGKGTSGSQTINSLTADSNFVLSCTGPSGTLSKTVNVSVAPAGPTPIIVNFTSNTTSVAYDGSVTLSWSSGNANSCTASGDWSGSKGTSGSQTINSLTADSIFALSCTGPSGTLSKTVNVSVASAPTPITVNLTSNSTSVAYNGSVSLSWSSGNANSCKASGDWTGNKGTSGSQTINSLTADSNFTLSCTGPSGTLSKTVNVSVTSAPVTVSLSSNTASVASNGSITLSWSSGNASSCAASGDWSGSKNTSGSQTISSITSNSNYVLTCTGASSTASDTVNITVQHNNGTALLSWMPPTTNTDNSTLTDLAGYKVYYGTTSGSYNNTVTLTSTSLTSYLIENLASATWYFSITSYNSSNIESAYANEVSKIIN